MRFTKSVLKRQTEYEEVDDYEVSVEVVDLKMQYQIAPGEQLQTVLVKLQTELNQRFNQMVARDKQILPNRVAEAERWTQNKLFDDLNT